MTAQPPDPRSKPGPRRESGFPQADPLAESGRTRTAAYRRGRGSTGISVAWALAIGVAIVLVAGFLMAYAVIHLSGG